MKALKVKPVIGRSKTRGMIALAAAAAAMFSPVLAARAEPATPTARTSSEVAAGGGSPSGSVQSIDQRVDALLSQMTLEEKVQLMYGVARPRGVHSVGYVPGISRLGVPPLLLSDGPVGVKDSCFGEIYPDNCQLGQSTALPATVSLAASFDPGVAHDYGQVLGRDARARGVDVLYGPAMNIVRVPQGGRNFEYFSEDPYLTGQLATAWVKGLQGQDVAAQVKHYALNNQELDRHESSSNADERTIREIYLPAFHDAVTEGGAYSLMCANNKVNGTYNCENTQLLGEILKGEWAWPGVVGSDYAATNSAIGSVNGGLDQSFTGLDWGKWYRQLPDLVRQGEVSEALIDLHVRRVLTMMFSLNMFGGRSPAGPVDVAADGAFARTTAEQGTVLLKNDRNLLPLDASAVHSVAVIGTYADQALTGGGGSSQVLPYYSVSPVQGIKNRLGPGATVTTGHGSDLGQAATLAKNADVAIVVVNDTEKEGQDRPNINLPGKQDQLVATVTAANPRTVVVLNTGGPVTMPWLADTHALLEAWYAGEEDGNALAAVLFGDVDPSGRLPVTFPVNLAQDCCHTPPRYPDQNSVYDYSEGLQVGYRWYDAQRLDPLFPFGFGLSYTTFRYSDLDVTPRTTRPHGKIRVSVRVTNTGSRTGVATPQAYLGFPASVGEPPHRLVGTAKVQLRPGQSKLVSMTLTERAFSYWSTDAHNWDVAPGEYTVSVGSSSRDLPLTRSVRMRDADGVHGISVQAPDSVVGGGDATVTVTLANTGDHALTGLDVDLRVPHGWKLVAESRRPRQVPAHGQASFTFRVSAPADAGPGVYVVTAVAGWKGVTRGSATRAVSIQATQGGVEPINIGDANYMTRSTPTDSDSPRSNHQRAAGSDRCNPDRTQLPLVLDAGAVHS